MPEQRIIEALAMAKIGYGLAGGLKAKRGTLPKIEKLDSKLTVSEITTRFEAMAKDAPTIGGWKPTGLRLLAVEDTPESEGSSKVKAAEAKAAALEAQLKALRDLAAAAGIKLDA